MKRFRRLHTRRKIRLGSYAALLLAMIAYLLVSAVVEERGVRTPWITGVLFPIILFTTIGSAAETRRQLRGLIVLAVGVFILDVLDHRSEMRWIDVVAILAHILFIALTLLLILRHVFRDVAIGADMILGAVCAYLLLGFGFNQIYTLVETLQPGSFTGAGAVDRDGGYFSLVTLSTLGYGDVVPIRAVARSIAAVEAVVGQFYIAVIVARLVAMHVVHKRAVADEDPQDRV